MAGRLQEIDRLTESRESGAQASQVTLAESIGLCLLFRSVQQLLDVTPQELLDLERNDRVLGILMEERGRVFPFKQFDQAQGRVMPGMEALLPMVSKVARISVAAWFGTVSPKLEGLSPADVLRIEGGMTEDLRQVAVQFASTYGRFGGRE